MTSTVVATDSMTPAPPASVRGYEAFESVRVLVVASLMGGAAVHAAVVGQHLDHWPAAGLFFVVLAVGEFIVGVALLRRVDALRLLAALALSVGPLVVWLVSRTAGLPFGPEAGEPEPFGMSDAVAGLLAVTAAGGALLLLRAAVRLRARMLPAAAQVAGLALVAVVTLVGWTSAAAGHAHAEDPSLGSVGSEHNGSGSSAGVEVRVHS